MSKEKLVGSGVCDSKKANKIDTRSFGSLNTDEARKKKTPETK